MYKVLKFFCLNCTSMYALYNTQCNDEIYITLTKYENEKY